MRRTVRRFFRRLRRYKLTWVRAIALAAIVVNTAVAFDYAVAKLEKQTADVSTGQVEQHKPEQDQVAAPSFGDMDKLPADAPEIVELEMIITEQPPAEDEPAEAIPSYTAEELEMTACLIYQEVGGDKYCDNCRRRVADVAWTRVEDDRFPDTLEAVLTQKSQYGRFHWSGVVWPDRAQDPAEAHAVERAYRIAKEVLEGNHSELWGQGYIWQAEFLQGSDVIQCCGTYYGR